jgi:hypothetical protein
MDGDPVVLSFLACPSRASQRLLGKKPTSQDEGSEPPTHPESVARDAITGPGELSGLVNSHAAI